MRCGWVDDNELMKQYHDNEWGRPCHNDRSLFELLSLEMMQAGLSWKTVLNKRVNFKNAFANFSINEVKNMTDQVDTLMQDKGIIRNQLKIKAVINNAQVIAGLPVSFDEYIWKFVDNKTIKHNYKSYKDIPSYDELADKISKQMKSDGFKFVGPVTIYSFMQAAGLVNDHETRCFIYSQI
ncbi:DNA-3-methyladenine glycosylase I [Apilactobacillus apisilvae]|uniref:DNA-3-methyladenine glycosylase I n=1 Tax=Apilactobacillus apisilvae TaxID=2923364 RepID=A0ABY4PH63_9LACO|nr:DNA-3-methyladenine glycosylase I [Apilactobacillus apisilvae]UQS84804.1 DNA-3-methyladenine glycosylase I [Apilactobacillus apisilvae]